MAVDTRARAIVLLTATFLAGTVAGAAVWPRLEPRRNPIASAEPESERIPEPLLGLGLSGEERTRLHAIARRWRPRADSEFNEVRRHVSDMENGMFAEMLCVLTPEQRDKYLALMESQHYGAFIIDKRFAIVRADKCDEVTKD